MYKIANNYYGYELYLKEMNQETINKIPSQS